MTATQNITLPPPHQFARRDFEMVVRRLADDLAFGADVSLFVGSGLEYASSRPYQPGDSVRMLNWRLTARTGKPFVKEYEALKRVCTHIVVDTSASMSVRSGPLSKHDVAVWIAAAIGLVSLRRLSPVALVGGGERATMFHPSLVSSDLWRALEPLRAARPAEQTRLAERLGQLVGRAGMSSVIIVLTDFHDPAAVAALRHAAQRHDCIALHTLDPAETGRLRAGFFRGREAETGRGFIGHSWTGWNAASAVRADLARAGIDYLALHTNRPFLAALRRFLTSRTHMLRGRR